MPSNRSWSAAGPRFSSTSTALRNPTFTANARRFSGDRTAAFNSRTASRSTAHLSAANRSHGFDRGRVIAQHSASTWHRNWDRGRDHSWHGHRCHFQNGFWFIYDPFLWYPYGYGYGYDYYPYETYYDASYDSGTRPVEEYGQTPEAKDSEYTGDARVTDVQSALAREGYYDGAIDGKLGPSTRNALRRYQRDHGLDATGGITSGVIQALRLR
ncbi:MAG: peptidoglycan-binding protein [Chthoniobacterales bacterium]